MVLNSCNSFTNNSYILSLNAFPNLLQNHKFKNYNPLFFQVFFLTCLDNLIGNRDIKT